ncbi:MAG: AarF/ABC1/UbiB kinase family protein [Kineosporiaceae bacterium]|nr:AarF/ABC1/UbiB kinase family protein [Kineosporiaceae bacterium]MBK7622591.1 AarF/ABC1/UbiB kinase family protein [Kineosporiaceae bacterium]MBK8078573.1 AarF/ABC1/UbiB kinase family protein [Kineosporiaceae bacterium]
MSDLPRRAVTRTAKLATLPLGLAGRTAIGLGKRVGGRPAELVAAELQARTAEQLFKVLGELKGGAMKFGQALSVFEAAMPEEVAGPYRATLTKLQDAAPPMPARTVHGVLAKELGPRWRRYFREFDDSPAAAASIGQVHKAIWKDGREVAVKVQYPGAREALLSDLAQVSRVGRMAAGWIPGLDIKPILAELRDRMSEELDYSLEAQSQHTFATAFADDEVFAIPDVVRSSEHLIVSEWLDGVPLSRLITDGDKSSRDLGARRYMEFLLAGPARAGLLHADPHPGNYRLTEDGRFGILDFGAVKRLPEGMPPQIGQLLTMALSEDAERVVAGLRDEGFIKPTIQVDPEGLLTYLSPFLEPARHTTWTFSRSWMRDLFTHINDPRRPQWSIGLKLNLPPEYLLVHRVWLGGVAVLCQIGGEVPVLQVLADWLPGFDVAALDYVQIED